VSGHFKQFVYLFEKTLFQVKRNKAISPFL